MRFHVALCCVVFNEKGFVEITCSLGTKVLRGWPALSAKCWRLTSRVCCRHEWPVLYADWRLRCCCWIIACFVCWLKFRTLLNGLFCMPTDVYDAVCWVTALSADWSSESMVSAKWPILYADWSLGHCLLNGLLCVLRTLSVEWPVLYADWRFGRCPSNSLSCMLTEVQDTAC